MVGGKYFRLRNWMSILVPADGIFAPLERLWVAQDATRFCMEVAPPLECG